MPTYSFKKQNGQIIQKLFPINNIPNEIECQDGTIAIRFFKPCNFSYHIDTAAQEDAKKRSQQQHDYMQRFGVAQFQPLKGQSQQQAKKDFEQVKYKMQQQLQQKAQQRKKRQKQKRQKKKKSFNESARLYFKGLQQKKQRQFNKNKLTV